MKNHQTYSTTKPVLTWYKKWGAFCSPVPAPSSVRVHVRPTTTLLLHSPSWLFPALAPRVMACPSWCCRSCPPDASRGSSRACLPMTLLACPPRVVSLRRARASLLGPAGVPDLVHRMSAAVHLVHALPMTLLACPPRVASLTQECRTALTRLPPAALVPFHVVH